MKPVVLFSLLFAAQAFALIGGIPLTPKDELSKSIVGLWVKHRGINGMIYCSGTLLTPKVILTAAHCIEYDFQLEITVGFSNEPDKMIQKKNLEFTRISHKAIMADGYLNGHTKWDQKQADVALVFLDSPAPAWAKPLSLLSYSLRSYPDQFTAVAAGQDLGADKKAFMNTKRADFKILKNFDQYLLNHQISVEDRDPLIEMLQTAADPREKLFLAENTSDYQLAHGDSGSPALVEVNGEYQVLGVLSGPLTYSGWVFANFYVNLTQSEIHEWIQSQLAR